MSYTDAVAWARERLRTCEQTMEHSTYQTARDNAYGETVAINEMLRQLEAVHSAPADVGAQPMADARRRDWERLKCERDGWKQIACEILAALMERDGSEVAAFELPPLEILDHFDRATGKGITAQLAQWWANTVRKHADRRLKQALAQPAQLALLQLESMCKGEWDGPNDRLNRERIAVLIPDAAALCVKLMYPHDTMRTIIEQCAIWARNNPEALHVIRSMADRERGRSDERMFGADYARGMQHASYQPRSPFEADREDQRRREIAKLIRDNERPKPTSTPSDGKPRSE